MNWRAPFTAPRDGTPFIALLDASEDWPSVGVLLWHGKKENGCWVMSYTYEEWARDEAGAFLGWIPLPEDTQFLSDEQLVKLGLKESYTPPQQQEAKP